MGFMEGHTVIVPGDVACVIRAACWTASTVSPSTCRLEQRRLCNVCSRQRPCSSCSAATPTPPSSWPPGVETTRKTERHERSLCACTQYSHGIAEPCGGTASLGRGDAVFNHDAVQARRGSSGHKPSHGTKYQRRRRGWCWFRRGAGAKNE